MKNVEITKGQFRISIALGFTLGMFALIIFAFNVYIKNMINLRETEYNNYINLIDEIKETCGTYPNYFTTLPDGNPFVKCGVELKPGVEL